MKVFAAKPQKVNLFAGGSTATKYVLLLGATSRIMSRSDDIDPRILWGLLWESLFVSWVMSTSGALFFSSSFFVARGNSELPDTNEQ